MEFRDYMRILRRSWALILILAVTGVAGGLGISLLQQPKYVATTQLYISVRTTGAATVDLVQGQMFARQMVTSYVDIVSTPLILDPVVAKLGLGTTAAELAAQVTATARLNTVLIDVNVADSDPERAAEIANAVAASFTSAVQNTLERPVGSTEASPVRVTVTQPATTPTSPASPNLRLVLALGGILGLAAGIALAVLRTVLDTRIRTPHDVERITSAPVLGRITRDPDAAKRPLIVHDAPHDPRAESFRALRTNLRFLDVDTAPRIFVVSSASPGEGKTTTAANLAIALAETGARVALIDGDLRRPRIAAHMGVEGGVGLTDVLIGRVELVAALQRWGRNDLFVLASGRIPPNPSELLGSAAMDHLLAQLGDQVDYVLIDAPPLLPVTDAAVVATKARGVLLVAAAGETRRQDLTGAVRALGAAGAGLLGVIVTKLPPKGPDSYGYGAYAYAPTGRKTAAATPGGVEKRADDTAMAELT
ncbi:MULTISPECIES: polysaccharide biosynthesis tyrosine autokinase [Bacteria]|uniref:polysaccharide biosynthesis tyrosine autokinase n=1 Tax=Bacteria TaxID=2 RepID=UPI003C7BE853